METNNLEFLNVTACKIVAETIHDSCINGFIVRQVIKPLIRNSKNDNLEWTHTDILALLIE